MIEMPTEAEPVRIIQGDCLDVLRTLPDGCVDAVVTDPPYGISRIWKGGGGRGWGKSDIEKLVRNEWDVAAPPPKVWGELERVAEKVVIWGGNYFPLPPSRGWFVWVKPERGFTLAEAELAWTNVDTVVRCYDAPRHVPNREHSTQKPVPLMRWCLRQLKLSGDAIVLDPFGGSGTTGVACIAEGRRCILIEKEPAYVAIAQRRIDEAMGRGKHSLFREALA